MSVQVYEGDGVKHKPVLPDRILMRWRNGKLGAETEFFAGFGVWTNMRRLAVKLDADECERLLIDRSVTNGDWTYNAVEP